MPKTLKHIDKFRVLTSRSKVTEIFKLLRNRIKQSKSDVVEAVGGYRRGKPKMKDLDILTNVSLDKCAERLGVEQNIIKTRHKITFMFKDLQIDINYAKKSEWVYALLHHTGDYMFNVYMRAHAKSLGYKLNQYGLFMANSDKRVPKTNFKSEKQIFKFLKFPYREPYERIDSEKEHKHKSSYHYNPGRMPGDPVGLFD